jgi:ribosome biogenesis GTPase
LTRGTIIKGIAGFYYVKTFGFVYLCRARGIFKKDGVTPLVGDEVMIEIQDGTEGVVSEILPRKNAFVRPPIANIDVFVAVVSAEAPAPNPGVLDRFLVTAEAANVASIVCVNKTDLKGSRSAVLKGAARTDEAPATGIETIYAPLYPTVLVSAKTGEGIEKLKSLIGTRRAAFAGPSGVGKSSLVNAFFAQEAMPTGSVSEKTGRGRHTTRHVEIVDTDFGAAIYDTPGYTAFEVGPRGEADHDGEVRPDVWFPEIASHGKRCRFDDCRHLHEPNCAVTEALREGLIAHSRYNSYVRLLSEAGRRTPQNGNRKGNGK